MMDKKPFDFPAEHRDGDAFLACPHSRQVVHNESFSIRNMTAEELRQSIVCDILAVTMWEIQSGKGLKFDVVKFLRFIPSTEDRLRTLGELNSETVYNLTGAGRDKLRIIDSDEIRQKAMDFCGVFFTGYVMPEGCFAINREALDEALEQFGGVDNLAASIQMDINANVPITKPIIPKKEQLS